VRVNQVDLVLLALLAVCAIRGYWRGVFRESMGLVGLGLGLAAAAAFWQPAAALLHRIVPLRPLAEQVVAAGLLFAGVNLLAHLLAMALDGVARVLFLGGVTRLAGAVVGVGKGAALLAVVLFLLRSYAPVPAVTEAIGASSLGEPLAQVAESVLRRGSALGRSPESRGA
jgi:membrane protein required for colicin V production